MKINEETVNNIYRYKGSKYKHLIYSQRQKEIFPIFFATASRVDKSIINMIRFSLCPLTAPELCYGADGGVGFRSSKEKESWGAGGGSPLANSK